MIDDNNDLTKNKFLGNKLEIFQFSNGYRGNMDSVLVAASVEVKSGQKVLELGSGNGVALCCLLYRIRGLKAFGIEIDKNAADLCRRNINSNKLQATIINGDITDSIDELKSLLFDHIFMNPPYFKKNSVKNPSGHSSVRSKVETVTLSTWFSIAKKRCKPSGKITIIQRVDRLPEIIESMNGDFGKIIVQPISSFEYSSPKTVIVQATKNSRAPFKLLAPKIVHKKDSTSKKVVYNAEFKKILQDGLPLILN